MRKPSEIGSGLLLMGALAGAAFDAGAQPAEKPEFTEVLPSDGFHAQDQTLRSLLKQNPELVQNAYFLAIPLDEAAYSSQRELEDGLFDFARKTEPRIGAQDQGQYRTYDVFVFAGITADGLPVIKYVPSAQRDYKECYIPTRVKGYWEEEGQRYYLTDLNLGQISEDSGTSYSCDEVKPYTPPVSEAREAAGVAVVRTLDPVDPGNKTGKPEPTPELTLKTPGEATPAGEAVETVKKPHHVQAAVLLGGGIEEFGHASLGGEGIARVQGLYTLPGAPLGVGLSSTFLFTPEASGLYGLNLPVGYHGERFGVYLAPGISFEPRRPETTLNGSFGLALEATAELWSKGALGVECAAGIHTRLYGGAPIPGFNVSCGGTWDFALHGKERPAQTDAVLAVTEVEVKPDSQELVAEKPKKSRFTISQTPYVFASAEAISMKSSDGVAKAEYDAIVDTMKQQMARRASNAVLAQFAKLEKIGIKIENAEFERAIDAARAAGNVYELNRISRMYVQTNPSFAQPIIDAIEANYSVVEFDMKKALPRGVTLIPEVMPFDPDQMHAIEYLNTTLQAPVPHELFFPLGKYSLLEATFTVEKGKKTIVKVRGDFSQEKANEPQPLELTVYPYPSSHFRSDSDYPVTEDEAGQRALAKRNDIARIMSEAYSAQNWGDVLINLELLFSLPGSITAQEYMMGAEAAYKIGEVSVAYDYLLVARQKDPNLGADLFQEIEENYASVVLLSQTSTTNLVVIGKPKDEVEASVIKAAQAQFQDNKNAIVFLPTSVRYSLDGHELEMKPLSEGGQTYSFVLKF